MCDFSWSDFESRFTGQVGSNAVVNFFKFHFTCNVNKGPKYNQDIDLTTYFLYRNIKEKKHKIKILFLCRI